MVGNFRRLRGLRDLLPEDTCKLNHVVSIVRLLFKLYGYEEIITPTIESFELLAAKSGEEIRHRMYVFEDLGGRRVALRPEMTASVARFFINNLLSYPKPVRLGYVANCFRYDEPQFGRYREFWQGGFELLGSSNPEADVEILEIADELMSRLGFKNHYFKISHIGVLKGFLSDFEVDEKDQNHFMNLLDRSRFDEAFNYLSSLGLSEEAIKTVRKLCSLKGRFSNTLFDKAYKLLLKSPSSLSSLQDFREILKLCSSINLLDKFIIDFSFARGLEYYTGIIFEFYVPNFRLALGGGGRYDRLIELFGGPPTPAVGFSPGLDRIILAMEAENISFKYDFLRGVHLISIDRSVLPYSLKVAKKFRDAGIPVVLEVLRRGLRRALSHASSQRAPYAVIIGGREYEKNIIILKDLDKGEQYMLSVEEAIRLLRNKYNLG
ncbi:MAG: histidine--tRNA ligase [Candidatus Methanomethylicota archaeon]|nr:MAG: histidine--tRNA ligase [Candidatus Verstraetearchaeota archaeon]